MAYDSVGTARTNIAQYFDWYNVERPHSSLDRLTPKRVYETLLPKLTEAA
jgi:putative transposase